jgi:hypothetical protein
MCLPEEIKKTNTDINKVFDAIKAENGIKTTEGLFGLYPQPKNNCPYIDEVIGLLFKDIDKLLQFIREPNDGFDEERLKELISKVQDFYNYEGHLNELRNRCDSLRDWGESWKVLSKRVTYENDLINKYKA